MDLSENGICCVCIKTRKCSVQSSFVPDLSELMGKMSRQVVKCCNQMDSRTSLPKLSILYNPREMNDSIHFICQFINHKLCLALLFEYSAESVCMQVNTYFCMYITYHRKDLFFCMFFYFYFCNTRFRI